MDKNFISLLLQNMTYILAVNNTAKKSQICGRVNTASATKTVNSEFIPGQVKPNTLLHTGIHSFHVQHWKKLLVSRYSGSSGLTWNVKMLLRCLITKETWYIDVITCFFSLFKCKQEIKYGDAHVNIPHTADKLRTLRTQSSFNDAHFGL